MDGLNMRIANGTKKPGRKHGFRSRLDAANFLGNFPELQLFNLPLRNIMLFTIKVDADFHDR